MEIDKTNTTKILINVFTILGIVATVIFFIYGFKTRIFTSSDELSKFVLGVGVLAPLVFVFIQLAQVVFPILPGSIGCAVGVIVFGPVWGFVYNYIGICIGSIISFLLSKKYGLRLVKNVMSEKNFEKYGVWLDKGKKFDKFFTIAIFLPVAPDDILCYLAGLTPMSLKKYTAIILLGKPLSLLIYSMGLTAALSAIGGLFH